MTAKDMLAYGIYGVGAYLALRVTQTTAKYAILAAIGYLAYNKYKNNPMTLSGLGYRKWGALN